MALKCWVHPLHLVSTICASVLRLLIYCSHLQSCITPPLCISQIILVVIIFLEINLLSKAPICQNSCCPPPSSKGHFGPLFRRTWGFLLGCLKPSLANRQCPCRQSTFYKGVTLGNFGNGQKIHLEVGAMISKCLI